MNRSRTLLLACLGTLAGCAAQGDFPSLAPRPVELGADAEASAPTAQVVPAAVDPAVAARIAALLADAREGDAAFEAALPQATSAVEAAGEATSESWIAAQLAISKLEARREATVVALAELDRLAIASAGTPALEAVTAALAEARGIAEAQVERINALRSRLSPI
jgi:hypothetical protein